MMKKITIVVRKDKYGYLVKINDDFFDMNDRASMPNGVNMYSGTSKEVKLSGKIINILELSDSTKIAIIDRLKQIIAE